MEEKRVGKTSFFKKGCHFGGRGRGCDPFMKYGVEFIKLRVDVISRCFWCVL